MVQWLRNLHYWVSFVVPMPFRSTYGVYDNPVFEGKVPRSVDPDRYEHANWLQWRGHIWFYNVRAAQGP